MGTLTTNRKKIVTRHTLWKQNREINKISYAFGPSSPIVVVVWTSFVSDWTVTRRWAGFVFCCSFSSLRHRRNLEEKVGDLVTFFLKNTDTQQLVIHKIFAWKIWTGFGGVSCVPCLMGRIFLMLWGFMSS